MPNMTPIIDPDDPTVSGILPELAEQELGKTEDARLATHETRAIRNGGAMAKRSDIDVEMDYVDEARLYLGGYNFMEIAEYISKHRNYVITYNTVAKDIKTITERWRTQQMNDIEEWKVRELSRVDRIEKEYWEAWENSKKAKTIVEQNKADDTWLSGKTIKGKAGYSRSTLKRKHETRDPNIDFMKGVQWCVEQRCKILGLHAPQTLNINWRQQAKEAGINPDGIVDDLAEKFFNAALAGDGLSGSLGDSPTETGRLQDGNPIPEIPD